MTSSQKQPRIHHREAAQLPPAHRALQKALPGELTRLSQYRATCRFQADAPPGYSLEDLIDIHDDIDLSAGRLTELFTELGQTARTNGKGDPAHTGSALRTLTYDLHELLSMSAQLGAHAMYFPGQEKGRQLLYEWILDLVTQATAVLEQLNGYLQNPETCSTKTVILTFRLHMDKLWRFQRWLDEQPPAITPEGHPGISLTSLLLGVGIGWLMGDSDA